MLLETPIEQGLLFVIGIFAGVLSGLMGVGGGLLIVPSLTALGLPVVQATATSLVGVFLSTTSGSVRNLSVGDLKWKASLILALFGVITAQVGAWMGERVPDAWLSLSFGVFLLVTIYLMNLRKQLQQKDSELETYSCELSDCSTPSNRFVPLVAIGALAGALSGLFGIGGGVVKVPLQMLFLHEPIKTAVRTSLGAISAIAVSGLAQHAYNHNVLWVPGLCLGMGGIIGAQVGTRLLPKLSDQTVNILFVIFLLTLSVYMSSHGILELASQTNSLK